MTLAINTDIIIVIYSVNLMVKRMNNDLVNAAEILQSGQYTCVLCRGDSVHTEKQRGVKPLIDWIDSGEAFNGFSAADRVVGNAAAFLYVLMGVKAVYALVISEPARNTLDKFGIYVKYDNVVKNIINRSGTGICPMEESVKDVASPSAALNAVRVKLKALNAAE